MSEKIKLMDQVREVLRLHHYSLHTDVPIVIGSGGS